ncbi:hypothetical protein [Pseudomonas sp. CGJS7]|uniref:hypothetical protein n=1 Tax=Pseudomonas sp. CGJS7 TaxID=3109348 RepID=UPI003008A426
MELFIDANAVLDAAQRVSQLPAKVALAQRRALGTLRRRWPVIARRDIQTEYALSAQRIRAGLSVRTTREGVELMGVARGVGLRNFGTRKTPMGLSYSAVRGKRGFRRSGFQNCYRGAEIAFVRTPTAGDKRVPRTPVVRLYGPSLAQMLRKGGRPERMAQAGLDVITADIDRLLLRSLRR